MFSAMLFVEEYEVEPSKLPAMLEILEEAREVIKELDLPCLKNWVTYQCKEEPKIIREVWVLEEHANVQQLDDAFIAHPRGKIIPPRFMALLIENSYANKNYDELISL